MPKPFIVTSSPTSNDPKNIDFIYKFLLPHNFDTKSAIEEDNKRINRISSIGNYHIMMYGNKKFEFKEQENDMKETVIFHYENGTTHTERNVSNFLLHLAPKKLVFGIDFNAQDNADFLYCTYQTTESSKAKSKGVEEVANTNKSYKIDLTDCICIEKIKRHERTLRDNPKYDVTIKTQVATTRRLTKEHNRKAKEGKKPIEKKTNPEAGMTPEEKRVHRARKLLEKEGFKVGKEQKVPASRKKTSKSTEESRSKI